MRYKCLSIAGFDGSGGAGIQADLKTFSALGCYGMTVLTALPVQNTQGVKNCYRIPIECIQEQLQAIFEDIPPNSIKIGMLFTSPIINLVSDFLKKHATHIPIVLDPVMIAKSGDPLLLPDAIDCLKNQLIPLSTIVTPNLPEAYALTKSTQPIHRLGQKIIEMGAHSALIKGGHSQGKHSDDFFLDKIGDKQWLRAPRIESENTHGTGCTLSAAICAFLAQGFDLITACKQAKRYLLEAIRAAKKASVGSGRGPVHHFYHIWPSINLITGDKHHET